MGKTKSKIKELKLQFGEQYPNNCYKCALFTSCNSYKIPARLLHHGHTNKTVLIVCQNPGVEEDKAGEILVGKSGQLLQTYIRDYLAQFIVWGTNAVKCFSPKVYMQHIKPCAVFLAEDLISIHPDKVIAMGEPAKKALTYLSVQYDSCVHPAYVLRGNTDTTIRECFSRVQNELGNKLLPIPIVNNSLEELYRETKDVVGIDFEWNPDDHKPFVVGSALRDKCVGVVLDDDAVRQVKRVLDNPYLTTVGHNIVEDIRHFLTYSTPKCKFIDTLILKRELSHNLPDGSLEFFANRYLALEEYKHSNEREFFTKVSPELLKRAAGDSWASIKLWDKFRLDFPQEYLAMQPARDIDMGMIVPVAKMIYFGIGVDMNKLWEHRRDISENLVIAQEAITSTYNVNPRSPEQVLAKFIELGCNLKDTRKETLKGLTHPLAQLVLNFRSYDKVMNNYLDVIPEVVDDNNLMHCSLNIAGAVTGRLTSSNVNMQNQPPLLRDMYCSTFGDDGVLASWDAVQSELVCLAYLSGSKYMIDSYANKVDFHSLVVKDLGIARKPAKVLNFACVYGAKEQTLINQLILAGISPQDAPDIATKYIAFMKQLGIIAYQEQLITESYNNGYVSSPYGRRSYKLAPTEIVNYPIQAFSADLNKQRIITLERLLREEHLWSHVWLELHDACEIDIYKPELDKVIAILNSINTDIPDALNKGITMKLPCELKIHKDGHWG